MAATPGSIRTPDQRLRIFVSSTLKELADERRAVRGAVERLHLAPVMFELGARPHPPRDLYRAYLQQSDIFVGLYWERYGWVAPGETVSGLEDEYILAPVLPKLIYIKESEGGREPRLGELLDRIRSDDTASFKYFSTPRELAVLVEADLATLLAERFDQSRSPVVAPAPAPPAAADTGTATGAALPSPLTELIGRDEEMRAVQRMLVRDRSRLVTLTGPGGIGKSRLAIAVASALSADDFPDGSIFVDLSAVHDPAAVPGAIAVALGVRDTGDAPLADKLETSLKRRRLLLVIDNVEQVVDAAEVFTRLLAGAPGLSLLLTSRTLLRVSAERSFEVGPLALPSLTGREVLERLAAVPSVALFVERVHAVKPDFELDADNVDAVARICVALDGVPLALELAAARIRLMSPASMLQRLDRRLPLLVGGARDLPARQQTLRSTIEWSTGLLGERERALLATLGVFEGGFFLEAAEAVAGDADDVLAGLALLVDNSLVRERDRADDSHFSMLATVREYALEQLAAEGRLDEARRAHTDYYVELGRRIELELEDDHLATWVLRLGADRDNLRAAVRALLDAREWDVVADFAWTLYVYWWVGGLLGEVRVWMDELLDAGDELSDRARAIGLYFTRAIIFWQDPDGTVVSGLTESVELFRREEEPAGEALALISLALARLASASPDPAAAEADLATALELFRGSDDAWGESLTLVTLGRVALLQGRVPDALADFEQSLAIARRQRDDLGTMIALHHLGWASLLLGDAGRADAAFADSLRVAVRLHHDEGIAYGLEGLVAIAVAAGQPERAGLFLGAAESLREQTGIYNAPAFSFHQGYVDSVPAGPAAEELAAGRARGRDAATEVAVAAALATRGSGG
jgi:predicted ATPase